MVPDSRNAVQGNHKNKTTNGYGRKNNQQHAAAPSHEDEPHPEDEPFESEEERDHRDEDEESTPPEHSTTKHTWLT